MSTEEQSRARGPRLIVLLLGLAVLPLLGVASVGWSEYENARSSRMLADDVSEGMNEVSALDEVRLALTDERLWNVAYAGIEDLGLPFDLVVEISGLDVEDERTAARRRVDELVLGGAARPYRDEIVATRLAYDTPAWRTLGAEHERLDDEISTVNEEKRRELLSAATDVPGAGDVVLALGVSDAASTARMEYRYQVLSYVRIGFADFFDQQPDLLASAGERDRVGSALGLVDALLPSGSPTRGALDQVGSSPQLAEFDAAWVDAFERIVNGDAGVDGAGDAIARLVAAGETLQTGVAAFGDFDRLTEVATDEARRAGLTAADASEVDFRNSVLVLAVLAVLAVVIAGVLTRYIARPMTRLAAAAERLGDGSDVSIHRRGPAEVRHVADALDRAARGLAQVERLEHEATHDDLTGVATRRLVERRLGQAIVRQRRAGGFGAFMFVDLDHFKTVNDTYGHQVGDLVLTTVAARLGAALEMDDDIGRYGGDEFVVVAQSVDSTDEARHLAERIVDTVSAPIDLSEAAAHVGVHSSVESLAVTVSVGVAEFGRDTTTVDDVIRWADAATYAAKDAGRNRAVVHDSAISVY
ncbi:MAG: sensor domain-containing diguanylate cyclase [Actinomycetota bacterium]